jgi:purine-binding chemotaxis protein CheW
MLPLTMARFAELVDRFLFRPDEAVGPFLDLAPAVDDVHEAVPEEALEEFLAFELDGERYAIPVAAVREILKVGAVTEVPRAEGNLIGVINVRGEMLPLYDVKVALELATQIPVVWGAGDLPRAARVVLVRDAEGDAGILVDRVLGTVKLSLGRVEPPPTLGPDRSAIAGLVRKNGVLHILLDVEQVLG